jgi:hypothetical protein
LSCIPSITKSRINIISTGNTNQKCVETSGGIQNQIFIDGKTWITHTFLSSGYLNITNTDTFNLTVEYLIVGGGGGGGYGCHHGRGAGGGGAGGFRTGTLQLTNQSNEVIVGSGGKGSAVNDFTNFPLNGNGNLSSFAGIQASGGGRGGFNQHNYQSGINGGSGGGVTSGYSGQESTRITDIGLGNIPAVIPSQGNNGGWAGTVCGGGGGGGAGGSVSSSSVQGGAGGVGRISAISGSSIMYARGGSGGNSNSQIAGAFGGSGTGNGGGGGGGVSPEVYDSSLCRVGGDGGSGIVIIRYTLEI